MALGAELRKLGVAVAIGGVEDYRELAGDLPFFSIGGRISELMDWELVYRAQKNVIELARVFRLHVRPLMAKILDDARPAVAGARLVVASTLGLLPAYRLGCERVLPVHFHPVSFDSKLLFWLTMGDPLQALRRENFVMHAYPPELGGRAGWGPWLTEDRPFQPDPVLREFLDDGLPPVYIGFGSLLAGRDPDAVTRMLVEALRGRRGLIYRGWGDLGNIALPEEVLAIGSVPHGWLFPQVSAVVTHAGIGTIVSALRAEVPIVTVPFFGDQLLWGRKLAELGLAPPPIPRAQLSAPRLARALEYVPERRLRLPNRVAQAALRVKAML